MAAVTSKSTPPTVPLYSTESYPSEPIAIFPPPLPLSRRTLRSRRGVDMSVQIPPFPMQTHTTPSPWSAKGPVQPHRNHLPRRRNPKRMVIINHGTPDGDFVPAPLPLDTPYGDQRTQVDQLVEDHYKPDPPVNVPALQKMREGLYVAFGEGSECVKDLPEHQNTPFTHVITILQGEDDNGPHVQSYENRVQNLRLVLAGEARAQRERKSLALSDAHLRAARDFIAEALPGGSAPNCDTGTRVLVTTPFGRPTDAMSIIAFYLASSSKGGVTAILKVIDDDENVLSAWKGEISQNEEEQIEKMAKAWSWVTLVNGSGNQQRCAQVV